MSRSRVGRKLDALEQAAAHLPRPPGFYALDWLALAELALLHDLCAAALDTPSPAADAALDAAMAELEQRAIARAVLKLDMGEAERQARLDQRLLRLDERLVSACPHPLRPGWYRLEHGEDLPEAEALACTAAHPWP